MIEQGYPGGPRPEGAHRAVSCHCGLGTVARRTLIADIYERLAEAMPHMPQILERRPDLRKRLERALFGDA